MIQKKTNEKFNVVADILNFIKYYNNKYKTKININIILQSDENEKNIINKICNYILEFYFDFDFGDDSNDQNLY